MNDSKSLDLVLNQLDDAEKVVQKRWGTFVLSLGFDLIFLISGVFSLVLLLGGHPSYDYLVLTLLVGTAFFGIPSYLLKRGFFEARRVRDELSIEADRLLGDQTTPVLSPAADAQPPSADA